MSKKKDKVMKYSLRGGVYGTPGMAPGPTSIAPTRADMDCRGAYMDCPDESLHGLPRKWAYMDCPEKMFFMELIPIEPNDAKKKI